MRSSIEGPEDVAALPLVVLLGPAAADEVDAPRDEKVKGAGLFMLEKRLGCC